MSIDVKQLQKVIALCRKTGVTELELEGIKLKLSTSEPLKRSKRLSKGSIAEASDVQMSDDDLLFYSSTNQDTLNGN